MTGREELLAQIAIMNDMAEANICRLDDHLLRGMAHGLKALISKEFHRGISREDVARYYKISTRTLERWANQYDDFPTPRHFGGKDVSYETDKVIEWKKKHNELFAD